MERDLPQQIQGKIFPWPLSYLEFIFLGGREVITENVYFKKGLNVLEYYCC